MKYLTKYLLIMALFLGSVSYTNAQVEDCTTEELEEIVCVDLGQNMILPMTLCEYNQFSQEGNFPFEIAIVDCDEDWDNELPGDSIPPFDCDCMDEEPVFVCIDLGDGFPFPITSCELDCFGADFGEYQVVDCDEDWNEWGNEFPGDSIPLFDCDCMDEEPVFVCVDLGDGFAFPMSTCELECFGTDFGVFEIVECDEDWNDWDNELPGDSIPPFECDCFEDEPELVCIDLGDGFTFPITTCELECFGDEFGEYQIVECNDDWNDWDNELPGDSIPPLDCDCSDDEPVFLCIDLGEGFIIPITTCELECIGGILGNYTIVDCEDDGAGDIIIGGGNSVQLSASSFDEVVLYPNPSIDNDVFLELVSNTNGTVNVEIYSLIGQKVYFETTTINSGTNKIAMNLAGIDKGFYTVTVKSDNKVLLTERLIRD